jgi:hypothetical protein
MESGRARVDYLACSRLDLADHEVRAAAAFGPVLLDFLPGTGAAPEELDAFPWLWLNQLAREVGTPWTGIALEPPAGPAAASEPESLLGAVTAAHAVTADRLPVPLLLQPAGWPPGRPLGRFTAHPDFARRAAEAADCRLLLHLGPARAASRQLGLRIDDYLRHLPLDRLHELRCGDPAAASLAPLDQTDFLLVEWLLRHARPRVLTLDLAAAEPGAERLALQLRRLQALCAAS